MSWKKAANSPIPEESEVFSVLQAAGLSREEVAVAEPFQRHNVKLFLLRTKCRLTEDFLSNNPVSWYNKTSFTKAVSIDAGKNIHCN